MKAPPTTKLVTAFSVPTSFYGKRIVRASMPEQNPAVPQAQLWWYKDAIIYEVHVRAFADSNEDGVGDFPGLTSKLDYQQGLSRQLLLERVDALLYLAKKTGRNRVFGERQTLSDY